MTANRYKQSGTSYYRHPLGIDTPHGRYLGVTGAASRVNPFEGVAWGINIGIAARAKTGDDNLAKIEARQQRWAPANLGKAVHAHLEHILGGDVDYWDTVALPDVPQGYRDACQAFADDWIAEVLHIEAEVFSPTHGYAGTADLFARLRTGKIALLDAKTGRIHPEAAIQLAAYRHGDHIIGADNQLHDMPAVDVCALVEFNDNGTYALHPVRADAYDFATFLRCLDVARWDAAGALADPIAGPPPFASEDRHDWLRGRVAALLEAGVDLDRIAGVIADAVPPNRPLTDPQVDAVADALTTLEGHAEAPWPDTDPAAPLVTGDDIAMLVSRRGFLPGDLAATVGAIGPHMGRSEHDRLADAIAEAEDIAEARSDIICGLDIDAGDLAQPLRQAACHGQRRMLTDDDVDRYAELVAHADLFTVTDGVLEVGKAGQVRMVEEAGGKGALLDLARQIAADHELGSVKASADVMRRPLLAAYCWASINNNNNNQGETAA